MDNKRHFLEDISKRIDRLEKRKNPEEEYISIYLDWGDYITDNGTNITLLTRVPKKYFK